MGLCDKSSQAGDEICVAIGAQVPYVVRPTEHEEGDGHSLVGEAYVHEFMDGSFMSKRQEAGEEAINIVLV